MRAHLRQDYSDLRFAILPIPGAVSFATYGCYFEWRAEDREGWTLPAYACSVGVP